MFAAGIAIFSHSCTPKEEKKQDEMVDAFVIVNDGFEPSNEVTDYSNDLIYSEFEKQYAINKTKIKPWRDKAMIVKSHADELINFMEDCKIRILETASEQEAIVKKNGARTINLSKVDKKDNQITPTQIMIDEERGIQLKQKIHDFSDFLIKMIEGERGNESVTLISGLLNVEDHMGEEGDFHSWESNNFEYLPLMAVITILSKIQGDVRNAENIVLRWLLSNISMDDNQTLIGFCAVVCPSDAKLNYGEDFKAEVFLPLSQLNQNVEIYLGEFEKSTLEPKPGAKKLKVTDQGIGKVFIKKPAVGKHSFKGFIRANVDGKIGVWDFSVDFLVE